MEGEPAVESAVADVGECFQGLPAPDGRGFLVFLRWVFSESFRRIGFGWIGFGWFWEMGFSGGDRSVVGGR